MATVLLGWELGGERGHLALLEPVAQALRERGHVVHTVVKDPGAVRAGSALSQGRLLQAPAWPLPVAGGPASETVGDDFVAAGLGAARQAIANARAWLDLIERLGVDLVLAETAPTLLLAARGRCRAIAFGTAYSLPPPARPLPPALDAARAPSAASLAREEALRVAYDAADRALGGAGLARFADLFDLPAWICNLAELDPYAALRAVPAQGPLTLRAVVPATRPRALGERVFVYAKPAAVLPALMDALAPRCRHIELFVADAPPQVHNPWPHVILHREPVDLARRLGEFSAVAHFGGLNLSAEALVAGVPQLVLPQHLEQSATAAALQRLGAGHCRLQLPREPERAAELVALVQGLAGEFFADGALAQRAAALGASLRQRQRPSLPGLVALCERLLAS